MTDDAPPTKPTGGPPPLPATVTPIRAGTPVSSPAAQPFPPAPSVATGAQLTELAKLINRKLDGHSDNVEGLLGAFHKELALLRATAVSNADTMQSPSPPTLARSAAQHAVTAARVLTLAVGAVGIAMQAAAWWHPSLVGPLHHLRDFLDQLQQIGASP